VGCVKADWGWALEILPLVSTLEGLFCSTKAAPKLKGGKYKQTRQFSGGISEIRLGNVYYLWIKQLNIPNYYQ
jgi:hypothetical protein